MTQGDPAAESATISIRVRYAECDRMGLLHHANYFVYFEIGRTELLRARGTTYREVEDSGQFLVVVDLGCRYRRPARYDDLLELRTAVARVTHAKIQHTYTLSRNGLTLAEGHTTLACIDRDGRPRPLPDWLVGPGGPV